MTSIPGTEIVLASKSPRRLKLLGDLIGPDFTVEDSGVDESLIPAHPPHSALALARAKAEAVSRQHPGKLVIAADTIVELDGLILGKPSSKSEAEAFLRALSGRRHKVVTAVCILRKADHVVCLFADSSDVLFKSLSDSTIAEYMRLVDVMDKAGAYAAQEHGQMIIDHIDGSISNVVGLPVEKLRETLAALGVEIRPA